MAEEPRLVPDEEVSSEVIAEQEDEDLRSYGTLGTVLLVILVIVVILLFWRSCATGDGSGSGERTGGVIESVDGLESEENAVSVWVRPGGNIDTILARNGLSDASYIFMGEGTYIITTPGTWRAEDMVAELKADPDLYDAGFVYTEEF